MATKYFINITNGEERGFVYKHDKYCTIVEKEEQESFVLYDYFQDNLIFSNRQDYGEINKRMYDKLLNLQFLYGEGEISLKEIHDTIEKIIEEV